MKIFNIDLHVHTRRYSPCAEFLNPKKIGRFAQVQGLDGVVITEHNRIWPEEEFVRLQKANPEARLYRGVEISVGAHHIVAIGLDSEPELDARANVAEILDLAIQSHSALVLAHPYRDADPTALPVAEFDAIEIASTSFSSAESMMAIALASQFGKPQVAGSDAHALSLVGWAWTEFPCLPGDERELADLIRLGVVKAHLPVSLGNPSSGGGTTR